MPPPIPPEFTGQKYLNLTSFRKSGAGISTPPWFAEENGKLYIMTCSDSGKYKRIRNNPEVRIAPCTVRGRSPAQNSRPGFASCNLKTGRTPASFLPTSTGS